MMQYITEDYLATTEDTRDTSQEDVFVFPTSSVQTRLWFLSQLEGESSSYNMSVALHLTGRVHIAALERAVQEIVRRHEALRTTFPTLDGFPVQAIIPTFNISLPVVDLQQLPKSEQSAQVRQLAKEDEQSPFDLANGPLLRVTLLRLGKEEHVLLVIMHHIITDGWSMTIFKRELSILYEAFSQGAPSPLPELVIQYADFALWQHEWLTGEVLESQLIYWKRQLGGNLPVLQMPTDHPHPPVQNYQGAWQSLVLSKKLTEALKALSQRADATLFMTLLAAFKILLYRYAGQEDIIVGTPIAGRSHMDTEALIGCFINTLALRTNLGGNPSFLELLGRVREVALEAYDYQDISFEKLVEELQPQRNLSRHPVFDIMFNFINTPQTALELPGLTLSTLELDETQSSFSITLYAEEHSSELSLQLLYQRALFSPARIACLLNQYKYLLEQIAAAPDQPIGLYSLVTPESQLLLPDPSAVLPEPQYDLVTTMFTSWVNRTPEHSAVCQGDRSWNYGELSASAHALAKLLLSQGVKRGEVVAVFGQRSFGIIASIMGVLLSGGVLLTIDPKLPSHRQQIMLEEANAKYLLYLGNERPEQKSIWESLTIIGVDPDTGKAINSETDSSSLHLPQLSPEDAAYIFFTSGTTGVPKGVLGCHKGLAHFLNWQRQTFAINQQDRSAQLTGISFDVVLRDIFLPLTSGATLCLPIKGNELEPMRILRWMEHERISLLHTVPTLAQSWLVNIPPEVSLRTLRCVFFAGEPLTDTLVSRWRETFPQSGEIVNLYGPTETTLAKCYYRVPTDILRGIQPVGLPLPETQALVLAENNKLCGIGESGQIVLRTPFRSLGYINAKEENCSRFVNNFFRNDELDLLYYTGDRGRYRPDGYLEILGRVDRQVKIRGVRIELREIETVLGEHPAVREVVVIVREDQPGDQRLVAYIVVKQEQVTTHTKLRRFLKQKLPDYMLPSAFVFLEVLPVTANGKVDRLALPVPDIDLSLEASFVTPRDTIELQLAQIWEEILNRHPIGVQDNFFDLGGHSLLAISLMARIQQQFGKNLALATLFQGGTIEQLASILRQETDFPSRSTLVAIQPNGSKPPFFCVHPGSATVLCYFDLARHLGSDQPFYGLESLGISAGQEPLNRIEDMAAHYIKAMQVLQPQGPYLLGGWSFGGIVAFEMARQLLAQGQQVSVLALLDSLYMAPEKRQEKDDVTLLMSLLGKSDSLSLERLQQLNQDERLIYATEQAKRANWLPPDFGLAEAQRLLQVFKGHAHASKNYIAQPYAGKVTLFCASEKEVTDSEDPTLGWGELATMGVDIHWVPGNHYSMVDRPHVQILAAKLRNCLEQAQAISFQK